MLVITVLIVLIGIMFLLLQTSKCKKLIRVSTKSKKKIKRNGHETNGMDAANNIDHKCHMKDGSSKGLQNGFTRKEHDG